MSPSSPWKIVEHRVPSQHVREYPAATTITQESVLYLAVKQYIPLSNINPPPGDATIIVAPGGGFGKELYEPVCEELLMRYGKEGLKIRSIWAADPAHQAESNIINRGRLGIDRELTRRSTMVSRDSSLSDGDSPASHFDHSRDLLHLINVKRDDMPRPIVAIGHSAGCLSVVHLSLMHPRLFHAMVLFEAPIFSVYRREAWPSRPAATESLNRKPFYQAWDRRVFTQFVKYGLRDVLAKSEISDENGRPNETTPVRLTTPLVQELASFARPYHNLPAPDVGVGDPRNRLTHPDLDPEALTSLPFYRPEITELFPRLPYLRPSVLYIFGSESHMSLPELRSDKLRTTDVGSAFRNRPYGADMRRNMSGTLFNNLDLTHTLANFPKILIVALNGPVVGFPAALIAQADFIYAAPHTFLLTPFSSLGVAAEGAASRYFVQRLGMSKANEALIMSKRISCEELVACGFVNGVVTSPSGKPEDSVDFLKQVLDEVHRRFDSLAARSCVVGIKDLIRKPERMINIQQNCLEVFAGLDMVATGVPEQHVQALVEGQKKHKL
ncbi:hypothetical protein CBS13152_8172 [Aspergillus niger]|nr:hypothetical protein CBS13152_8172 [Aspergillus niger]